MANPIMTCNFGIFSCRTSMWMQPAPAHHLGPMRMRLREPAWTNPLCRVASHALFCLVIPQRIGIRAGRRAETTKTRRGVEPKVLERPENLRVHLARKALCDAGTSGKAHAPSPPRQRGTSISPISATRQQDQIGRSREWWPRRPGTSHPLSRIRPTQAGMESMRDSPAHNLPHNRSLQSLAER
jgi:hypothetical protein